MLALSLFASIGVSISIAAPYVANDDEVVYLLGAELSHGLDLPDTDMLKGYDYGPYLYPVVMHMVYEHVGFVFFKVILLILLILSTGSAAYYCFRLLLLPHAEAMLLALVVLMPRLATGTEFFGVLTFKEAVGRSLAVPLFFFGSSWLMYRLLQRLSVWPVFLFIGVFSFLHPVTVLLFAVVMFIGMASVFVWREGLSWRLVGVCVSAGVAYLVGASYFLIEVVARLYTSSTKTLPVNTSEYVEAVLFRNSWEFPEASMGWLIHLLVVSIFFIVGGLIAVWFLRKTPVRQHPYAQTLFVFGGAVLTASIVLAVVLPGLNLYMMRFHDAPYVFQQWSRIGKFFYIGMFFALVPVVYMLGQWVRAIAHTRTLATLLLFAGLVSSSFFFEIAQFIVGYDNVTKEYIPQKLSLIEDDVTPQQYREVCALLPKYSANVFPKVLSNDFSFRYYCHADLFATLEEGAAHLQFPRDSLVAWHKDYLRQRTILREANPDAMIMLARETLSDFIIVPKASRYQTIINRYPEAVLETQTHVIVVVSLVD